MRGIGRYIAGMLLIALQIPVAQGQEKAKPPPTRIEAKKDTLRSRPQPVKKKPEAKIEIPDVLIYGRDTMRRLVGEKLSPQKDSLEVVAPPVSFERRAADGFDQRKMKLDAGEPLVRQTRARFVGGRFATFTAEVARWGQSGGFDYTVEARLRRSNGQFPNSEYTRVDLGGAMGLALGPKLRGEVVAALRAYDYGLQGSTLPDRDRQVFSGELRSRWLWSAGAETEVELSAEAGALRLEPAPASLLTQLGATTDRWFRVKGKIAWGPSERRLSLAGDLIADHYNNNPIPGRDVRLGSVWGAASVRLSPQMSLLATLGVQRQDVERERETFFAPQAKVLWQASQRFAFHASAGRELRYQPFVRLLDENAYLSITPTLLPEKVKAYMELGIEYKLSDEVTAVSVLRNERMDRYGFWQRSDSTGLFDYRRVDDVGLTTAGLGLRVAVPSGIEADMRLLILDDRRGQPGSEEAFDLPYRERYQVPLRFSYRPSDQVRLRTTSTWVSSRRTRLDSSEALPAFWVLDAEVEVQVTSSLALVVQGRNLTDRRYSLWQGFPEMGVVVMGGVVGRW
jgi:hypothetical protein